MRQQLSCSVYCMEPLLYPRKFCAVLKDHAELVFEVSLSNGNNTGDS